MKSVKVGRKNGNEQRGDERMIKRKGKGLVEGMSQKIIDKNTGR